MKNITAETFTAVPFHWSSRRDVPLPLKVIVAYIYTRANIDVLEWELVAADIANMWGLPKATVSKVLKYLESQGVIKVTGWRKQARNFPSKIYRIDRSELEKLMAPHAFAVHPVNRRGSSSEPHQFIRGTAPVHPVNLEEEVKEEIDKKSLEEEEKSGAGHSECHKAQKPYSFSPVAEALTPASARNLAATFDAIFPEAKGRQSSVKTLDQTFEDAFPQSSHRVEAAPEAPDKIPLAVSGILPEPFESAGLTLPGDQPERPWQRTQNDAGWMPDKNILSASVTVPGLLADSRIVNQGRGTNQIIPQREIYCHVSLLKQNDPALASSRGFSGGGFTENEIRQCESQSVVS